MDTNVILFCINYGVWAYNIKNTTSEERSEVSFMAKMHLVETRNCVHNPFALKATPTVHAAPSRKTHHNVASIVVGITFRANGLWTV